MIKKLLLLFSISICTIHTKNTTVDYLRTFGRSSLTGFAQGLAVGHYKRDFAVFKNEDKVRSWMWFAGTTGEIALHWKIRKEYSLEKFAVGFFGLGVGQITGEIVAALQDPDHSALQHTDVLNMHLHCAAALVLYYAAKKILETRKTEIAQ